MAYIINHSFFYVHLGYFQFLPTMKHVFKCASLYLEMIISLDRIPRKKLLSQKVCMFKIVIDTGTLHTSRTSLHFTIMYESTISYYYFQQ